MTVPDTEAGGSGDVSPPRAGWLRVALACASAEAPLTLCAASCAVSL